MSPRGRAAAQVSVLAFCCLILFLIFPKAFAFVELAARELRYLWWLVLLIALGLWLIWGFRKKT